MRPPLKYLLLSLGIIAVAAGLLFWWAYPDNSKLGPYFSLSVVALLVRDFALYAGIVLLLLRLVKLFSRHYFLYVFVATLNGCIGLLGILLYVAFHTDLQWLHLCLYNLLLGLLLLSDSFLFPSTASGRHS